MQTIDTQRRGLSTVLTTIIILVASVTLGAGVVLYGASLFQGSSQTESISVGSAAIWVDTTSTTGRSWGAVAVRNTGDKVLAIDTIQVRGTPIPFTQWYPDTSISAALYQKPLNFTQWTTGAGNGGGIQQYDPSNVCSTETIQADLDAAGGESPVCANAGTGPVSLSPGSQTVIYFKLNNNTLTSLDSGASTTLNVFAGKAGSPLSVTVQGKS